MRPTCCRSNATGFGAGGSRATQGGWLRLAAGVAAILVLWLAILPWIAHQPPVQRHIEFLEQRHIDPSAMFYTELEPMGDVRTRMARLRRQHPGPFWQPAVGSDRQSLSN